MSEVSGEKLGEIDNLPDEILECWEYFCDVRIDIIGHIGTFDLAPLKQRVEQEVVQRGGW